LAGHGEKLSRKQEQAIAALLGELSVRAAAEKVGVNECTLRNWLKQPAFASAYRAARRQIVEVAVAGLQRLTLQAVEQLNKR
jgi:hypothetical protein